MKAIQIKEHGGPETLLRVDLPDPQPRKGQVLVRVTHVGLNHLDVWVRKGVPGHHFPLPLIPGSDVVGVRVDTGEPVALQPGVGCMACQRCLSGHHNLCARYRIRGEGMDGGCCEYIAVSEAELLPCPLPAEQAVALPLSLLTAWHMLVGRARVQPGDHVLVQGGAGGVGSLAIQVGRVLGAHVAAVASTPEKRALCLELGAEQAWSTDELKNGVRAWTGNKKGVDVVVEHVGAATWDQSVRALRWGGALVTCGATAGHQVQLDLRVLFFKQISLLGSTMGSLGELCDAWQHVSSGAIRPVVDAVVPMSDLARGHALLEERRVRGKVVIQQDLT